MVDIHTTGVVISAVMAVSSSSILGVQNVA